jgi:hypothetical protein
VQPISVATIDRGLFPMPAIRDKHPLPEPSRVATATDVRRIRAWTIQTLEDSAANGDTLLPRADVITSIRGMEYRPECPVTGDLMAVAEKGFSPEIEAVPLADAKPAFQLSRLAACSRLIRAEVTKRVNGKPHTVNADWLALLAEPSALGPLKPGDEREARSRTDESGGAQGSGRIEVLRSHRFRRHRENHAPGGAVRE